MEKHAHTHAQDFARALDVAAGALEAQGNAAEAAKLRRRARFLREGDQMPKP